MAKITYETLLGPNGSIVDFYDPLLNLQAGKSSETEVVYKDPGAGSDKIVITGTGLAWAGDVLVEGTITGVTFTTKTGDATYLTIKGLSLAVSDFTDAYDANQIQGIADLMVSGSDTITGSTIADDISAGDGKDLVHGAVGADTINGGAKNDKLYGDAGNDYIWGDTGNDRMWGGAGSDKFHFSEGSDKDLVMDFDAKGGGKKQDYLSLNTGEEFTIKKSGDDLVLNFGDGDTLTLLDVKRADFSRVDDIDWLAL